MASASALCRFENRSERQAAFDLNVLFAEQFIASHKQAPDEIIPDLDATDDAVPGNQEGRFFHGYCDHCCFFPLYVFCGSQLLCAYLQSSNTDEARHAWAVLSLITKQLRAEWPKVKIIFRGDGGFCRWKMLCRCECAVPGTG